MIYRLFFVCLLFPAVLLGKDMTAEEYIKAFRDEAITEMKRAGVPASITLAQGMLESGNGNSLLAKKANNHFGIKCHSDWKGPTIMKDDDRKNECFRKYRSVLDSYRDHSEFLRGKSRYAFLFELDINDYEAWAKGLKKAGYATNPKYPRLLINLIERHELYQYDKGGKKPKKSKKDKKEKSKEKEEEVKVLVPTRVQVSSNFVKYVVVRRGESFQSLEKMTGVSTKRLLKYNERNKEVLVPGERIYLQPKKKSAREKYYVVQEGDNLYQISQKFGVKMKHLIRRNRLDKAGSITVGQKLKLRGGKI